MTSTAATGVALSAPSEIIAMLVGVIRTKAIVEARYANGQLRGTMDMIHPSGSYFIMTCEGNAEDVAKAAQSEKLVFHAAYGTAQLEFAVAAEHVRVARDDTILLVQVPQLLMRFDRRQGHRLALPPEHDVRCVLPMVDGTPTSLRGLRVYDMSPEGLALVYRAGPKLESGRVFQGCALKLPNVEPVYVALEVRHLMHKSAEGATFTRAGCRFADVPPAARGLITRYLTTTQIALGSASLDFADLDWAGAGD